MNIIKLSSEHSTDIRYLFDNPRWMSVSTNRNDWPVEYEQFADVYHQRFVETYLSNLKSFHAWGAIQDDKIVAILGMYESIDDASWYWTNVRTTGDNQTAIRNILDVVIDYNEKAGRLKFYSMFPKKYQNVYRRLALSSKIRERYDYFDEYSVQARHQCPWTLPWQILYNRVLSPVDTVVRCTFLKQRYRVVPECGKL